MPDPTLQATALRYAAGDLTAAEATAFEARLADDQDTRDALAEAVRLSAAAIGQKPPAPHSSLRAIIRARLMHGSRGHPLAWAGLGAAAIAACTLIGLSLADRVAPPSALPAPVLAPNSPTTVGTTPAPRTVNPDVLAIAPQPGEPGTHVAAEQPAGGDSSRSVAEIWADLSTHDHVEKARDDELRWRQRMRDLMNPHASAPGKPSLGMPDDRD